LLSQITDVVVQHSIIATDWTRLPYTAIFEANSTDLSRICTRKGERERGSERGERSCMSILWVHIHGCTCMCHRRDGDKSCEMRLTQTERERERFCMSAHLDTFSLHMCLNFNQGLLICLSNRDHSWVYHMP